MKPITHPLAIAYVEALACDQDSSPAYHAWCDAGRPRDADPTPLPAPALGMRAWYSYDDDGYGGKPLRCSGSADISEIGEGDAWDEWVVPDRIDLITDYRTGEVLWRRQ